jgi:ribosome-binding protein aMBF1 (putative translation factor)
MNVCFKCGTSGEKVRLHDVISSHGIVKVCDNCTGSEHLPLIKRMTEEQIVESQKQKSVRDRLTTMNNRNRIMGRETSLRDIIDRNLKNKIQPPADLIENFHWTIQRIKRARKITREEFAKAIGESDATVRMIEQGFLPNNDYKIINKIESYLKISLRKSGTSGFPDTERGVPKRFSFDDSLTEKKEAPKKLSFNFPASKELKIADLKNMKRKQEIETKSKDVKPVDSWEEEYSQDDEKFLDDEEAFDEDN